MLGSYRKASAAFRLDGHEREKLPETFEFSRRIHERRNWELALAEVWVSASEASRPLPFVCCPQKCSSLKKELTARPSENDCGKACWWHVEDILYFSVNGFIPRKLAPCCSGSRTKAGRGLTWRKRTSCSSSTSWPASSSSMRWASYCSSRRRGKREFFIKAAQKKKEIFLAVFIQVSNYPL